VLATRRFQELEHLIQNCSLINDLEKYSHWFERSIITIVGNAHFSQTLNYRVNINWQKIIRLHDPRECVKPVRCSETFMTIVKQGRNSGEFPFACLLFDGFVHFSLVLIFFDDKVLFDAVAGF
jgi:hypothetical protein